MPGDPTYTPRRHKLSEDLIRALEDHGWEPIDLGHGRSLWNHPASNRELPTPAWAAARWPGRTYQELRQLSLVYSPAANRFFYVAKREGTPWTGATETSLSFKKAIAYVSEPWEPEVLDLRPLDLSGRTR